MCGNFGLLALGINIAAKQCCSCACSSTAVVPTANAYEADFTEKNLENEETISVLKILEAQTACTEIRGGQAGGFSSLEYSYQKARNVDPVFGAEVVAKAENNRVRMVARKRHPLAADLSDLYLKSRGGRLPDPRATVTVIGHTRFATSSINKVSELHPHEWVPFHDEPVWLFNYQTGRMERSVQTMGLHITHNGDFDAMEAYQQILVVNDIGMWLERVHHVVNNTRGDSPKIAGSMDLMRVQGRWGPAARLSWIRVACASATDVCGGDQLSKTAPNTFPNKTFWDMWGTWFEETWKQHINNVIKPLAPARFDALQRYQYTIDELGLQQFIKELVRNAESQCMNSTFGLEGWAHQKVHAFIHHTVRGFLRGDLYTALTELLSRAEGSFGIQAHCTLEPGVVVIASKGQPMSVAYDPQKAIVLFASEAEALAVPVYKSGKWLPERIDLDSHGEIFRLGEPRSLVEGHFALGVKDTAKALVLKGKSNREAEEKLKAKLPYLLLDCGVEIRCYSLVSHTETAMSLLLKRSVSIPHPATPYDPTVDLVLQDLKATPGVLKMIDQAWHNPKSKERVAGQGLAECLVENMKRRLFEGKDTTDLLIGGVEISLWLGEQLAADLRRIFPNLNVSTVSANKLIGVGEENATKVFFPGSDEVLTRRIDSHTCVLLISQSGQTFPTLHATRKMTHLAFGKVWILTGCLNSKMEQAIQESYIEKKQIYGRDRLFYNYSGHRPAEPSSVAVAATWHTLTRFILHLIDVTRKKVPGRRLIHAWEQDAAARKIQYYLYKYGEKLITKNRNSRIGRVIMDKYVTYGNSHHHHHHGHGNGHGSKSNLLAGSAKQGSRRRSVGLMHGSSKELGLSRQNSRQNSMKITSDVVEDFEQETKESEHGEDNSDKLEDNAGVGELPVRQLSRKISSNNNNRRHSSKFLMPPDIERAGSTGGSHTNMGSSTALTESPHKQLSHHHSQHSDHGHHSHGHGHHHGPHHAGKHSITTAANYNTVLMNLSDGCIHDLHSLALESLIPSICEIVGHDEEGRVLLPAVMRKPGGKEVQVDGVHEQLVKQGAMWAEHINEPWHMLVLVAIYIFVSVGLGITLFCGIGDAVLAIIKTAGVDLGEGSLSFSVRHPDVIANQPIGFTLVGLALQIIDAAWFVWLGKNFTRLTRIIHNRPLAARHGKRTIVIVDNPTVHQLTEIFVSKLFSQCYSIVSVDVHGGSGMDHFVHRFTHRVARGLLIALGRPDGRLSCLSKSESSVLLAAKQAAFIRNPEYNFEGSGPEFITIGHNPFEPNLGLACHVVLPSTEDIFANNIHLIQRHKPILRRRKFVDEYLFDRLFFAAKPFTLPLLRALRKAVESGSHKISGKVKSLTASSQEKLKKRKDAKEQRDELLPYGVHHIDPMVLINSDNTSQSVLADFILASIEVLKQRQAKGTSSGGMKEKSSDPAVRLAFSSKLDSATREVQDLQVNVQQFYECRVASLERYMAFCVMFHSMAEKCCKPWFLYPWDIARSQSNLRVATTASPISAGGGSEESSQEVKKLARQMAFTLRKFYTNF